MTRFPLGRLFGIHLYLHWTFFLLLGWVGFRGYADGAMEGAVFLILLACGVFVCVVLHELGHSLAARRFGVPTHSITLYPIGGVARLGFIPRNPRHELVIAIAGPAVNLLIACLLVPVLLLTGLPGWEDQAAPAYGASTYVAALLVGNLAMILFNLIPAFPMDGGRVLRSLIAWKGHYRLATEIAARLGQLISLLFIAAGSGFTPVSEFRPTLMLIGLFILYAAESERRAAARAALLSRYAAPVPPEMPVRTVVIGPGEWEIHPR